MSTIAASGQDPWGQKVLVAGKTDSSLSSIPKIQMDGVRVAMITYRSHSVFSLRTKKENTRNCM